MVHIMFRHGHAYLQQDAGYQNANKMTIGGKLCDLNNREDVINYLILSQQTSVYM